MTITPCKEPKCDDDYGDIDQSLKDLVKAQYALGKDVIQLLGAGAKAAAEGLGAVGWPKGSCSCEIPEPCWMPLPLGEVTCCFCGGGTGEIKFIVTNHDFRPHTVQAKSAGKDAALVQISPPQAVLGPQERTTFTAKLTAPAVHGSYEALLWILGCRDHYLRWTIIVGEKQKACCYEVTVDDAPDYVVHWYDHFYCLRPCFGSTARSDQ